MPAIKPPVRRPRKSLSTTLGGEPWLIVFRQIDDVEGGRWGQTYWDKREIHLDPRVFNPAIVAQYKEHVTPREIVIHESLHAQMPWMDEGVIAMMAKELDHNLELLDL